MAPAVDHGGGDCLEPDPLCIGFAPTDADGSAGCGDIASRGPHNSRRPACGCVAASRVGDVMHVVSENTDPPPRRRSSLDCKTSRFGHL